MTADVKSWPDSSNRTAAIHARCRQGIYADASGSPPAAARPPPTRSRSPAGGAEPEVAGARIDATRRLGKKPGATSASTKNCVVVCHCRRLVSEVDAVRSTRSAHRQARIGCGAPVASAHGRFIVARPSGDEFFGLDRMRQRQQHDRAGRRASPRSPAPASRCRPPAARRAVATNGPAGATGPRPATRSAASRRARAWRRDRSAHVVAVLRVQRVVEPQPVGGERQPDEPAGEDRRLRRREPAEDEQRDGVGRERRHQQHEEIAVEQPTQIRRSSSPPPE